MEGTDPTESTRTTTHRASRARGTPEAMGDVGLKRKRTVQRPAKVPIIKLDDKGNVIANCSHAGCPRGMQPLDQFAPAASNKTHRQRAAFEKIVRAIEAIDDVLNDPEAMKLVSEAGLLRTRTCLTCRLIMKKTQANPDTKFGACRAKWLELKAEAEATGCSLCGCNDAVSFEHVDPNTKMRFTCTKEKGKPLELSHYSHWPVHGGPSAMQAEREKCTVLCLNCHWMQPTGNAMKRIFAESLPDGNSVFDEKAYAKKWKLKQKNKKLDYVDAQKLEVGKCDDCIAVVVPRGDIWRPGQSYWPHCFQWAHRSELDKGDGVAKLVTQRTSLATAKPRIDEEIARCRLLCMCCGQVETGKRASAPGPSEEGN